MKFKNKLYFIPIVILLASQLCAQNTNPVFTNVAFSISGTNVTVTYDVADAEQSTVTIIMNVSGNDGATWDFNYGTATGDIGTGVTTGTGKTITWTYAGAYNPNFKIRIYANDEFPFGSPCDGTPTVTHGNKTYNTIQIGTQCWLKENLNIGTLVAAVGGGLSDNGEIEKYCYGTDFGTDETSCDTYGGLYTWNEAMQYVTTEGAQGICPPNWHIPTLAEFTTLLSAVGGSSIGGDALLSTGPGESGTNTSGFSALFTGIYNGFEGTFSLGSDLTYFWSSTDSDPDAYSMELYSSDSNIYLEKSKKYSGYSVRCIKD